MFAFIKDKVRHVDKWLFLFTSVLSIISLVVLFGARNSQFGSTRNFIMQLAMTVVGLIIMVVLANIDFSNLHPLFYIIVFAVSAIFLLLLQFFGENAGENINWIKIPLINISIQPSEFVRFSFVLTFAKHLSLVHSEINKPLKLLGLMLHAGVILGLLLLSGDLGMVLVYVFIMVVMLFCAGLSVWYLLGGAALVALLFPFIWDHLATYQKERILIGSNPDLDPTGKGLQQILSRASIAGGGVFGRGISGAGSYKNTYGSLTDFFFSTYAEMFGFIGCIFLIGLYIAVIVRVFIIARRSRDRFGAYVCAGVIGLLLAHTIENIGMCLCLLPVIGITLPFLSAGGSSVLSIYLVFGLVHSASTPGIDYDYL